MKINDFEIIFVELTIYLSFTLYLLLSWFDVYFFSVELGQLETHDFGKLLLRRKPSIPRSIFFKPHPDTISSETPELKRNNMTIQAYVALFNKMDSYTEKDIELIKEKHHHATLMDTLITQDSGSDTDSMSHD